MNGPLNGVCVGRIPRWHLRRENVRRAGKRFGRERFTPGIERGACGRRHAERCEITGETLFCYTRDPAPLIADLDRRGDLRYLHRRANIEDVFLKLTGRDLRD